MIRGIAIPAGVALVLAGAAAAPAYRDGAPTGFTGGFDEPHCGTCHFGDAASREGGAAAIDAPARYRPGETYDIVVTVRHPDLEAAGFQLSVRFADAPMAGTQAGVIEPEAGRAQVSTGPRGVAYAGHTGAGTGPVEPGVGRWTVRWTAPETGAPVIFHLAANAANDDDSEFGDRIFLAEARVEAGAPPCP